MANPRQTVFISYARADGEAAAHGLFERLRVQGIGLEPWMDRNKLEGGIGWEKQIIAAIERSRVLILVMTPSAMKSPNVRNEWRWARQAGARVFPVKGAADENLDFGLLPRWMSKAHFYTLDNEWPAFLADLNDPGPTARVPFMAPKLAGNEIPREGPFQKLKQHLLDADHKNPVAISTALDAAGGFGKTTLAKMLCHDPEIIECFDDGILWVELGQKLADG